MPVVILTRERAFPSIKGEKKIMPAALMIRIIPNQEENQLILNDMTTRCDQE